MDEDEDEDLDEDELAPALEVVPMGCFQSRSSRSSIVLYCSVLYCIWLGGVGGRKEKKKSAP